MLSGRASERKRVRRMAEMLGLKLQASQSWAVVQSTMMYEDCGIAQESRLGVTL